MPDGLVAVLLGIGIGSLLAGLAQHSMGDYFGERVQQILRNNAMPQCAEKWNRERGERVTRAFSWAWFILGSTLILLGVVLFIVFGRL